MLFYLHSYNTLQHCNIYRPEAIRQIVLTGIAMVQDNLYKVLEYKK